MKLPGAARNQTIREIEMGANVERELERKKQKWNHCQRVKKDAKGKRKEKQETWKTIQCANNVSGHLAPKLVLGMY